MRALHSLNRLTAAASNAFALYLLQITPGYDFDAVARRAVAEAEAEGAALIDAVPCPGTHGKWDGEDILPFRNPCPICKAQK